VGVVDDLVAIDEHRHPVLTGQLFDFQPLRPPLGNPYLLVIEAELVQPSCNCPAPA